MRKTPDTDAPSEPKPLTRRAKPKFMDWRTFDPSSMNGDGLFVTELSTYKTHLDELLERKGQYVLIKGTEVIDFFTSLGDALEASAERFGEEPALIKKIVEKEPFASAGGLAL
jgi:hypothetical protein